AMGDLRPRVRTGKAALCPLDGGEEHVDGDVAVRVAVHLNAGAVNLLHPGVEVLLRLRDVSPIRRRDAGIWRAQCHCALGERSVDGMLGRRAELHPLVTEARGQAAGDERVESTSARFVAHAVEQLASRADILQRGEVPALVM